MTNGKRRSAGRVGSLIQLDRNPEINQRARAHRPPPAALPHVFGTLELVGAIIGSRLADRVTAGSLNDRMRRARSTLPAWRTTSRTVNKVSRRAQSRRRIATIRLRVFLLRHTSRDWTSSDPRMNPRCALSDRNVDRSGTLRCAERRESRMRAIEGAMQTSCRNRDAPIRALSPSPFFSLSLSLSLSALFLATLNVTKFKRARKSMLPQSCRETVPGNASFFSLSLSLSLSLRRPRCGDRCGKKMRRAHK